MAYTKEQENKIHKVMHEFKHGKLKSGSKRGKEVTDRKEAIAIAMSEAGLSKSEDIDHEKEINKMCGYDEIKKSFESLQVDHFIQASKVKSTVEKSYDLLNPKVEQLEKSLDTSKLIKKKVQIHGAQGKVYEGYRWVSSETGQPMPTGKESKPTQEFQQKKQKESAEVKKPAEKEKVESKHDEEFASKIKEISESTGKKSQKMKDLIGLGVYDPSLILQVAPDLTMNDFKYYAKESGVDYKQFQDTVASNINIGLGNVKVDKDTPVYELQQSLRSKDMSKVLKDKKSERASQLGITAADKFDAYKFKLDQLIGDRMTRSLIVYGTGGIGKTFNLQKKLEEYGKVGWDPELDLQASEYDYVTITGSTSATDLYNRMYENPKKLFVFDDCDSMWEDETMANLLKGALDTTGQNLISYANPKKLADGTYPSKSFKFSGQCIFVSNLPREKFYQPLIDSRSNALDLTMSMEQTLSMLDSIKYDFKYKNADGEELNIPKPDRDDIIKVLHELSNDLRVEQVNGRVLGNLAALKLGLTKRGHKSYDEFKKQAMIALDLV